MPCPLQAMAYVLSANMDMKVPDYKLEAAISKIFASVSGSGGAALLSRRVSSGCGDLPWSPVGGGQGGLGGWPLAPCSSSGAPSRPRGSGWLWAHLHARPADRLQPQSLLEPELLTLLGHGVGVGVGAGPVSLAVRVPRRQPGL